MNTKKIDLLNIVLIVISLILAIKLPFELFLFSYAILGPLHYLTEINWLQEKGYFIKSDKKWMTIMFTFSILISIYPIFNLINLGLNQSLNNIINTLSYQGGAFLLIGFLFAIGLIFFSKTKRLVLALVLAIAVAFLFSIYLPKPLLFIAVFLPTLVHVYLFTLLFIIYGALKSKSKSGFYLGIVLFSVPFVISFMPIDQVMEYEPSQKAMDIFISSNMISIGSMLAELLNKLPNGSRLGVLSELGLRIQIFIAFAYTYHYLNWFSKTSVIGWKKSLTKKKAILILIVWMTSVGIYIYDYSTGIAALFLLSFLHVFLEFPLNIITIKEIFKFKNPLGKNSKNLESTQA